MNYSIMILDGIRFNEEFECCQGSKEARNELKQYKVQRSDRKCICFMSSGAADWVGWQSFEVISTYLRWLIMEYVDRGIMTTT
jgi:hypothetical protein